MIRLASEVSTIRSPMTSGSSRRLFRFSAPRRSPICCPSCSSTNRSRASTLIRQGDPAEFLVLILSGPRRRARARRARRSGAGRRVRSRRRRRRDEPRHQRTSNRRCRGRNPRAVPAAVRVRLPCARVTASGSAVGADGGRGRPSRAGEIRRPRRQGYSRLSDHAVRGPRRHGSRLRSA